MLPKLCGREGHLPHAAAPRIFGLFTTAVAVALAACNGAESTDGPADSTADPVDTPVHGVSSDTLDRFHEGDTLFGVDLRAPDGLGPLYIRQSCASCHEEGLRGPGIVQKMSIVDADGVTPSADQSTLEYGHTVRPYVTAGAMTPLLPPEGAAGVKVTVRMGPSVVGRGYMEAVADSEIERVEAEQAKRTDGIRGRIHRVSYASVANPDKTFGSHNKGDTGLIGRFGLKARVATLDDFTADAFQGDMGMTSPMRPDEPKNPDGLTDDDKPGVDLPIDTVNLVAFYMRALEIPKRRPDPDGLALFESAACGACHVPSLRTRADYPISQLADIEAPVFTDFLLHDMGPELADGLPDGDAHSEEWRTAPLLGLRHQKAFLHDGRARTVEEAILAHAGEAKSSLASFQALDADSRATLLSFVESL